MPWGILFLGILAVLICSRSYNLQKWPLKQTSALMLLLALLILSYIDIPIAGIYINPGGIFLLLFCCWLGLASPKISIWTWLIPAILIAALLFLLNTGIIWQMEQYLPSWLPLATILAIIIAAASGGYRQSLTAAGIGVEIYALLKLIIIKSSMGIADLNIFVQITGFSWILLWIIKHFRRQAVD